MQFLLIDAHFSMPKYAVQAEKCRNLSFKLWIFGFERQDFLGFVERSKVVSTKEIYSF